MAQVILFGLPASFTGMCWLGMESIKSCAFRMSSRASSSPTLVATHSGSSSSSPANSQQVRVRESTSGGTKSATSCTDPRYSSCSRLSGSSSGHTLAFT